MVLLKTSPEIKAAKAQAGFTILPGNTSLFAFDGPTPFERAPKLERTDFVQNSNNSFWSTNRPSRWSISPPCMARSVAN